jgi:hypothetical protein
MAGETRLTPLELLMGRSVRMGGEQLVRLLPELLMRVGPEFCLVGLVFRHLFHDRRNGALTMTLPGIPSRQKARLCKRPRHA